MPELVVHTAQGEVRIPFEGTPLLHSLIAHLPDAPSLPCGGAGVCGGCQVMAQGDFSMQPDAQGKVLACQTQVKGDGEIWLPRRKVMAQIESRTLASHMPFAPVAGEYGAAVDLGTTTIVLQLIRLADGEMLSCVSCENPQRIMAADVIGRIDHALKGKLSILSALVRECMDELESEAFARARMPGRKADVRVISGNTTMLYLFSGRDPRSLSAAPFQADCLFAHWEGRDYLPACAGAFVGADITCAMLASQFCQKGKTAMLIDVGTNGEIALWRKDHISCCATAAGPAFEGAGISCGVGSIPGAVDSVTVQEGKLSFTTIQGAPASGICGSGLIDLVAGLLETEQLDETGALDEDAFFLTENVSLSQQDVRQVQLAKGAIAAGIQLLLQRENITCDDVDVFYIAGGFGSHLNLQNAARIGLIPEALIEKAQVVGNASLSGARQLLLSQPSFEEAARMAQGADCINLASCPNFSDVFMECMLFEE